jgi:uncharacterized membrane protein YagU involved in acid resistance
MSLEGFESVFSTSRRPQTHGSGGAAIGIRIWCFTHVIYFLIFGPTKENQTWRIKNNEELDKLIKHENIVN